MRKLLLLAGLALIVALGCSKRDNPNGRYKLITEPDTTCDHHHHGGHR